MIDFRRFPSVQDKHSAYLSKESCRREISRLRIDFSSVYFYSLEEAGRGNFAGVAGVGETAVLNVVEIVVFAEVKLLLNLRVEAILQDQKCHLQRVG